MKIGTVEDLQKIAALGETRQDQLASDVTDLWLNKMNNIDRGGFNLFLNCRDNEKIRESVEMMSESEGWSQFIQILCTLGLRQVLLNRIDVDPDGIMDYLAKWNSELNESEEGQ